MRRLVIFLFVLIFSSGCASLKNQSDADCYSDVKYSKIKPNISNTDIDPIEIGNFLCELKNLVANGERKRFSEIVAYPTEVVIKNNFKMVNNEEEFLGNYDEIVNEKVKSSILKQEYKDLLGNSVGVEIGPGVLWIFKEPGGNLKILRINNGNIHHYYDPEHPSPDIEESK